MGGWLVQINHLAEYNCLLRQGKRLGLNAFYWTDGNDVADEGIWTHAYDGSPVSFFAPDFGCTCTQGHVCRNGGDAFLLNIGGNRHYRGNFCDQQSSVADLFICEGIIYD